MQSGNQRGYSTQDAINRFRDGYKQERNNKESLSTNSINSYPKPSARTPSRTQWNSEFNYESSRNQINGYGQRYGTRYRPPYNDPQTGGQTYNRQYPTRTGVRYRPEYENVITNQRAELTKANTIDEINFHWTIAGFTECSRTCGGGKWLGLVFITKDTYFSPADVFNLVGGKL